MRNTGDVELRLPDCQRYVDFYRSLIGKVGDDVYANTGGQRPAPKDDALTMTIHLMDRDYQLMMCFQQCVTGIAKGERCD